VVSPKHEGTDGMPKLTVPSAPSADFSLPGIFASWSES